MQKKEGAETRHIQAYIKKKNLKENIRVNSEKQNQDSTVFSRKHNQSLTANELGKNSYLIFWFENEEHKEAN